MTNAATNSGPAITPPHNRTRRTDGLIATTPPGDASPSTAPAPFGSGRTVMAHLRFAPSRRTPWCRSASSGCQRTLTRWCPSTIVDKLPSPAARTFMQDCAEEDVVEGLARLVRQTVSATAEPVGAAAWREIPSTYLVCARDNGTPPSLQRAQAERAGRALEIDAGHHPFLSRSRQVAELVLGLPV
ncbi:alpha/beta hydrolase [Sphaerisporangium sp. NPDC004334]